ncbi:MAG: serine/threonine protein kinase, partial [Okeania sp. SIO2H7]|nr:serine/threonine protein kinase [Okeania sp. SIO2H7]
CLYQYSEFEGEFYLVQEWIDGVTLKEKVGGEGKLNESLVIEILIGVLKVLDYVHSKGKIHRDIKPENIILRSADGLPVLIDFGAVKEELKTVSLNNQESRTIAIGTPGYVANEQMAGRPVSSSDLYALGLTAIYLLTGKNPNDLFFDLTTSKFVWRNEVLSVSSEFGDILDKAIEDEAKDRYSSARQMLDLLAELRESMVDLNQSTVTSNRKIMENKSSLDYLIPKIRSERGLSIIQNQGNSDLENQLYKTILEQFNANQMTGIIAQFQKEPSESNKSILLTILETQINQNPAFAVKLVDLFQKLDGVAGKSDRPTTTYNNELSIIKGVTNSGTITISDITQTLNSVKEQ